MEVAVEVFHVSELGEVERMARNTQGYLNTGYRIEAITQSTDAKVTTVTVVYVREG